MLQISLQMLWKERKKALNLGITITITLCVCIIFLQFFNNPIINYLVNILKDTTKFYGYEAITEYEVMRFYDGMYKGTMVIILLVIFISLIMYSCNYYNKTNSEGLFMHFKAINDAVKTPIILYNVPSRTNMNITPTTLLRLTQLNNVVAIKEASGDLSQVAKMKALCGDKIDIYSGNDDQIVPIMSLGGIGVISVAANIIPKTMHEMCQFYLDGNCSDATTLQLKYLNLINDLFIETNPIPVKTAMNIMGMNVGKLRLPLYKMDTKNEETLVNTLKKYNLV